MTKKFDYYKAPSDEIFEDIKKNAIKIWKTYDDEFGYQTEKLNRIKNLKNIEDNAWYIVAMFDGRNKSKLLSMVKPETGKRMLRAMKG